MGWPAALAVVATYLSNEEQKESQREASDGIRRAAVQNATFLQEQGRLGQEDIAEAASGALGIADQIAAEAVQDVQPFATAGGQAFQSARDRIMGGGTGGIESAVQRAASMASIPGMEQSTPVQAEMARQARLTGQAVSPQVNDTLMQLGRMGIGAAGDIAGIQSRAGRRSGNILSQSGTQQASALIGQVPQIAQQLQGASEARILGDVAQQQSRVNLTEQLARIAGRYI